MSTRASLIAQLQPILTTTPGLDKIKLIESVRATDQLSTRPILIVKTDSLEKIPEAPRSVLGNFTLVLVSPRVNVDKAEEELDDLLEILLPALRSQFIMWQRATQTSYDDQHIAYDITVTNILS